MSTTETDKSRDRASQDQEDLGAAGSQLSTAPAEELSAAPGLGVIGWARWFWRQLTSMRVALLLLLLLSLGAIPGSLIPQSGADLNKVDDFRKAHKTLAPIYDKLGLFHVYSSVWFSAIYILLFVSLVGCIVPRTWQFVGQLRGRPPGAPKRLNRLPAYTTWRTTAEPEQVREAALALLKKRRFRAHIAGDAVAAEKGYVRELGNLAFHIALIVLLIAFASGQLYKSDGTKLMVEGDGFSNALPMYDDFKSGSLFQNDDLVPFSFDLKDFKGTYEVSGPNKGTPRTYQAKIDYSEGAYGKQKSTTIKVNQPLHIGDAKVYLVSHGYAPVVTVRDGKGNVVYHDAVPLLPLDGNVTSNGVVKVMDGYKNAQGQKEQLGFQAFFVPTFDPKSGTMLSQFPALVNPLLAVNAYHGDLGVNSGIPQSVYQLDKTHMKAFKDGKGQLLKKLLQPGDTLTLPNGAGSITFEKDIKEWAGFEIVQEPGSGWALGGALAAIFGLAASLFIQRRRVWVRAVRGADGVTVVEMAGLGRSESAKVPEELGDLAGILYDQAPGAPDPDDDPSTTPDPQAVPAEGAEKQ
ncbi:cytochrome c biogenesis protein ResB [Streptomyces sp. NPDC050743]|uniref:cytochrome c biogenesis protein ResB n=1 Tax=Streptomyces sp. NPDC050743 TaxID=3365634 RepID=UPI00379CA57B